MASKKQVKGFIAGLAFPATVLPFAFTGLYFSQHGQLVTNTLQFVPMYLPIAWGVANTIYLACRNNSKKTTNAGLWLTGIILGLLVAMYGVFVAHLPKDLFGSQGNSQFAPLIFIPIIYGVFFRYIVKWINKLLEL